MPIDQRTVPSVLCGGSLLPAPRRATGTLCAQSAGHFVACSWRDKHVAGDGRAPAYVLARVCAAERRRRGRLCSTATAVREWPDVAQPDWVGAQRAKSEDAPWPLGTNSQSSALPWSQRLVSLSHRMGSVSGSGRMIVSTTASTPPRMARRTRSFSSGARHHPRSTQICDIRLFTLLAFGWITHEGM